jgi:glycosyltransferase involved in cell wall biosynthesis
MAAMSPRAAAQREPGEDTRCAVVFCDQLLEPSVTFVLAQGEALRRFTPVYAGSRAVPGLEVPPGRRVVLNQGGIAGYAREALFKLTGLAPGLTRPLRRARPELVHAHFGTGGATALPLARQLRVPLVVTLHGYDATVTDEHARSSPRRSLRRYVAARPALAREGSLFIAVSEFIRSCAVEQGFPADRTVVHYIGIDLSEFRPVPAERTPVVLFVGRLVEKKGCELLIRAMAKVAERHPQAELVVIGDGVLRARLEAQAAASGVRHRFLGAQPAAVVREWMGRSRVFCVPSLEAASGDREGFGMVFLEAQAMGLPVVSFASGGVPEAVAHGRTGFLARERDWPALAAHIAELLGSPELWLRMSAEGVARAKEFDLARQTARLEELYDEAIERFAAAPGGRRRRAVPNVTGGGRVPAAAGAGEPGRRLP